MAGGGFAARGWRLSFGEGSLRAPRGSLLSPSPLAQHAIRSLSQRDTERVEVIKGANALLFGASGAVSLDENWPVNDTTWRARGAEVNATGANWYVRAYAICAAVAA